MKLFLMRHGHARDGYPDEDRVLSDKGLLEIDKLCESISLNKFKNLAHIWHSPYTRAVQTAKRFKENIGIEVPMYKFIEMRPIDDAIYLANAVCNVISFDADLMLVGHNPNLEELSDILLSKSDRFNRVNFRKGSLACFELESIPTIDNPYGIWSLEFLIYPDVLK